MKSSERDSSNWSEEREIVFKAVEIVSESERIQFVLESCGGNSELVYRVFSLLASVMSEHTPPSNIDPIATHQGTVQGIQAESFPVNADIIEPEVGPYRIVRKLGEGGIAVVFLAEQNTPIHRKVAIKLVKPGMESMAILERFRQEQQALESLSHNGISKLLDAGVSPFGRPYLVLEYIDGTSITEYCNTSQLSIEQRLELFLKACEAVHHAHQRGIIHRDLKPSNILISCDEHEAVATVIDFGIAKLLDARDPSMTAKTQIGQMMGTLEYMSPEQAQLGKTTVDIRSDVYALACILYELVTGHTPLAKELSACASIEIALTLIREQTPVLPLLCQRSINTKHSKSQSFGEDLECILMKGLDKSLSQRYSTVQAMIDDIRRYLNGETVLARKPTFGYVLARFANRHRVAIATVGVIVSSLIMALGVSIRGWIATSHAFHQVKLANEKIQEAHTEVIDVNKKLEAKSKEAIANKEQAENTLDFFLSQAEKAGPRSLSASNQPNMTVEELLDNYLGYVKEDSQSETPHLTPERKIEILSRLGRIRQSRFEGKPAIEAYQLLMPLLEEHCQNDKQKILAETFWYAKSLFTERKLENARSILESICPQVAQTEFEGNAIALLARTYLMEDKTSSGAEILKRIPPEIRSASIEFARGQALRNSQAYESAIIILQRAVEDFGTVDRAIASECLAMSGQCYAFLGQAEEGFRLMKDAIAANSEVYGKNHLHTYNCRGRLYESYIRFERYGEALDGFVTLVAELEATSADASIRKMIPMCRIRVLSCLAGLERYQELLQELEARPVDQNRLHDRERFELASMMVIALTKTGRQSEIGPYIEMRNKLNAGVPSDDASWNTPRERVMRLMAVSGVRLN